MAQWFFEPGHTSVEFAARHMMVTWVRGSFKDIAGSMEFDPSDPLKLAFEAKWDARSLWTGEAQRDEHLRSADFLHAHEHPTLAFKSTGVTRVGAHDFDVVGNLSIRGVTREVTLRVTYLGQWPTPWWEDGQDKGPKVRAGFRACGRIDRRDFGVNWNSELPNGGVVVGAHVDFTVDAEAIRKD